MIEEGGRGFFKGTVEHFLHYSKGTGADDVAPHPFPTFSNPSLFSPFDFLFSLSRLHIVLCDPGWGMFQPVTSPLLALLRLKVPFATTALNPVTSRVSFSLP